MTRRGLVGGQTYFCARSARIYSLIHGDDDAHSSEIRGLCLMKLSSEELQNLPYFWNKKTQIVFVFSFFVSSNFGFVQKKNNFFRFWPKIKNYFFSYVVKFEFLGLK